MHIKEQDAKLMINRNQSRAFAQVGQISFLVLHAERRLCQKLFKINSSNYYSDYHNQYKEAKYAEKKNFFKYLHLSSINFSVCYSSNVRSIVFRLPKRKFGPLVCVCASLKNHKETLVYSVL